MFEILFVLYLCDRITLALQIDLSENYRILLLWWAVLFYLSLLTDMYSRYRFPGNYEDFHKAVSVLNAQQGNSVCL